MNNLQKDYLNHSRPEYPKQNKGYTLHSLPSKNFAMSNSVPMTFYGGLSQRVEGHPTVPMSVSPIIIKSKEALEETIHYLKSNHLLPLYTYLIIREVNYLRVYFPSKDRYGKPKDVLGDQITEVIFEESLETENPKFRF